MTRGNSIRKSIAECSGIKERYQAMLRGTIIWHVLLMLCSLGIWLPFGVYFIWRRWQEIKFHIAEWHYRQAHLECLADIREHLKFNTLHLRGQQSPQRDGQPQDQGADNVFFNL